VREKSVIKSLTNMDSKKLIGGLLAGAAIGVSIGILIAPSSGRKTIKKLKKGAGKLTGKLSNKVTSSIDSIRERYNNGVDEAARKSKEVINAASDRIKA
jgi:gas vesicle protein